MLVAGFAREPVRAVGRLDMEEIGQDMVAVVPESRNTDLTAGSP